MRMFVSEELVAWDSIEEEVTAGMSRELRRKMVFRRTEIAGSYKNK